MDLPDSRRCRDRTFEAKPLFRRWVGDDGAARIDERLAAREVEAAMARLPEDQRLAVALVLVEGLSYKDAADTLGVPIGTVMSRLHRARQQLQKSLYDYAVESGIVRLTA